MIAGLSERVSEASQRTVYASLASNRLKQNILRNIPTLIRGSPSVPAWVPLKRLTTTPSLYFSTMSLLFRSAVVRTLPRVRGYANTAAELTKTNWAEKQAALKSHAGGVFQWT